MSSMPLVGGVFHRIFPGEAALAAKASALDYLKFALGSILILLMCPIALLQAAAVPGAFDHMGLKKPATVHHEARMGAATPEHSPGKALKRS